jgi:hypothetical protein
MIRPVSVEIGEAVGAHDLPVGAVVEDAASHAGPFERAADDRDDAATPARDVSQFHDRAEFHPRLEREDETRRRGQQ